MQLNVFLLFLKNLFLIDETGLLLDSGMEPILRARHIQVANAARATLGIASGVSLFM